jgi:hypothetical protein
MIAGIYAFTGTFQVQHWVENCATVRDFIVESILLPIGTVDKAIAPY